MGCCASARQFIIDLNAPKDLPSPSISGKDKLTAFELRLPFARTTFNDFYKNLTETHKENGGKGWVTIKTLEMYFTT